MGDTVIVMCDVIKTCLKGMMRGKVEKEKRDGLRRIIMTSRMPLFESSMFSRNLALIRDKGPGFLQTILTENFFATHFLLFPPF